MHLRNHPNLLCCETYFQSLDPHKGNACDVPPGNNSLIKRWMTLAGYMLALLLCCLFIAILNILQCQLDLQTAVSGLFHPKDLMSLPIWYLNFHKSFFVENNRILLFFISASGSVLCPASVHHFLLGFFLPHHHLHLLLAPCAVSQQLHRTIHLLMKKGGLRQGRRWRNRWSLLSSWQPTVYHIRQLSDIM